MAGSVSVAGFNFVLFLLYLVLVLFIGLQLARIVYYRHKIRSFQVGFLTQCFLWGLLRAIFFLLLDLISNTNWLLLIVYWVPLNLQYSTFSLLVVYYAYLNPIHQVKEEMRRFKRPYIAVWVGTNVLFLVMTVVGIVLGIRFDDPFGNEAGWLTAAHGYFTGGVFFILMLVMAYHAFKIVHMMRHTPRSKLLAKGSLTKIAVVTILLFLLFMSRAVYDFIMAAGVTSFTISSGTSNDAIFTFVAFCAWEIIPTILVLVLFGTVNSTKLGAFSNLCKCFQKEEDAVSPYASVKYQRIATDPQPGAFNRAPLFNDPKRYDSDEETSSSRSSLVGSLNSPYPVSPSTTPVKGAQTP